MLFIGHDNEGAASAEDDRRGLLLLLIDAGAQPAFQVCFVETHLRPNVGETITFADVTADRIMYHTEIARLVERQCVQIPSSTVRPEQIDVDVYLLCLFPVRGNHTLLN